MTSSSNLEEKTRKTLEALGVREAAGVEALFAEAQALMDSEQQWRVKNLLDSPAEKEAAIKDLRDRWLARNNGLISNINENWLRQAPPELKPVAGRCFNQLRNRTVIVEMEELRKVVLVRVSASAPGASESLQSVTATAATPIDSTLPGRGRTLGSLHPITRVQREIEDIFLGLGYTIETGPEIESVYYNFEALNIPETHASRDDQDTLYVDAKTVLRTHTSPVQLRAMEKYKEPPLYIVIPGKVYRRDNPDATHSPIFHQVEGLAIDKDITFADLKGILDYFGKRLFGKNVRSSFHPSFFPFTEPSAEVAFSCVFCDGKGCRVCKESGWVEMLGCGMIHPEVLRAGGFDPAKCTGWAFGMGIERLAMFKYGIHDIQLFYQSDVRFLEQFP